MVKRLHSGSAFNLRSPIHIVELVAHDPPLLLQCRCADTKMAFVFVGHSQTK